MCSKCMYTCMASRPLLFGVTVTLHVHEGSKLPAHSEWGESPGETPIQCCYSLPQYPGDSPHTIFAIPQIGNVKVPRPCTNSLLRNNTYIEVWCRLTWLFQNNSIMYHVLLPRQSCSVYLCFSVARGCRYIIWKQTVSYEMLTGIIVKHKCQVETIKFTSWNHAA